MTTEDPYVLALAINHAMAHDLNPFSLHRTLEGIGSTLEVAALAAGFCSKGVEEWNRSDFRAGKVLDQVG